MTASVLVHVGTEFITVQHIETVGSVYQIVANMDLTQYIADRSGVEDVDIGYLKTVVRMSGPELTTQNTLLETRIKDLQSFEQSAAVESLPHFVTAADKLANIRDLAQELKTASSECLEMSLAVLRPSEHPYNAIKALLANEMLVYSQINRVQELMALPEYVKDCVMDGDFNKALDVAGVAARLHVRYPQSQLVLQIQNEVNRSMEGLKVTLYRSLRETSKLSILTKAVGHLRKLTSDNAQLEQDFIEARWLFIQDQWQAIPESTKTGQPYTYLKRVIEIHREQVFAVISAVNTVFRFDKNTSNVSRSVGDLAEKTMETNAKTNTNVNTNTNTNTRDNYNISQFTRKSILALFTMLKSQAPLIKNPSERTSLWLQLAFCSSSLGRVGADFWDLLDEEIMSKQEWYDARQNQQEMASRASRSILST